MDGDNGTDDMSPEPRTPTFDTIEQERDHWKDKYDEVRDMLEEAKMEVEMIQLQSQEQESHVQSLGDEIESLARQLEDVKWEREEVRRKHAEEMRALNEGMAGMQLSIDNLTSERDNAKRAVVLLEQGNDDLEREHRNAHSSYLDIESKYNRLVEEKVLLEEELRMKTTLVDEVQRLKDVVREQNDEMTYLEGRADKHQRAHEEALQTIQQLEAKISQNDRDLPLRRSTSAIHLITPSPPSTAPVSRSAFMSPVTEGYEESPRPTMSSSSTMRTSRPAVADDSPGTPSQLPVLRPGRVDSLRSRGRGRESPGSPRGGGIRRSHTLSNMSPSPRSNHANHDAGPARGLNRSINSRHLTDLVGPETPTRTRVQEMDFSPSPFVGRDKRASLYGRQLRPLNMSTSSNTTVTSTVTARKQSTGASSALAGQRDMTSKTSQLLTRMGKLGAKSTASSVRTANTSIMASSYVEPKARVISRKSSFSQMAQHGVHAIANQFNRSQRGNRIVSTASSSSNRTVMALQQQDQEADLTMISGSPNDSWVHVQERDSLEQDNDSPTSHTNRGKTLRDRFLDEGSTQRDHTIASTSTGPLPSRPMIPSPMINKTAPIRQTQALERPSSRLSSHMSTTSSSSTRPPTPSGLESRVPVQPSSRAGTRSRTATASISQLPRPASRQDYNRGLMRSPSPVRAMPSGLPQPQFSGASNINPTTRSVRRTSAQLGQPGKQRLADPPGNGAAPVKSRIPRKSLPGRAGGTFDPPDTPVPALPASVSRGLGTSGIGRGLPSSAR